MRKLNACVFKAGENNENAISFQTINDDLDVFYDLIKCDCIDIVVREVGGREYSFIVDDEALLKNEPIVSYADMENRNANIFGNVIIVAADPDEDGELIGITEEDYEYIKKHVRDVQLRKPLIVNGEIRDEIAVILRK